MEPLRTYEYLVLARGRLCDRVRAVAPEDYARLVPGWPRSIARNLTHVLASEWYYIRRLDQRPVPPYEDWPLREEDAPAFPDLERAWAAQAVATRTSLGMVRDWHAPLEYRVVQDDGTPAIITASAADLFTQLVLHEVHHRGQVMLQLRHFGVALDDIDFNALMYRRRPAGGA